MLRASKLISRLLASAPRRDGGPSARKPRKPSATLPVLLELENRTLMSVAPSVIRPDRDRIHQFALVGNTAQPARSNGLIAAAEALNSTSIEVRFRAPVNRQLAARLTFEIAGLQVTDVRTARNGRSAILTTTPQDDLTYTATASLMRKRAGKAHAVGQGSARFHGAAAPRVLDVKAVDDTSILVTYDRAMGDSALLPQNYRFVDSNGVSLPVLSAQFVGKSASVSASSVGRVRIAASPSTSGGGSQVMLRTGTQSFTNYTFNISNVTDSSGQMVFFEGRKLLTGNPKGAVVSAGSTSATTVVVVFNEAMADNALAPQHYSIKDPSGKSLAVTGVRFDGPLTQVVVLTTAAQSNVAYQLTASLNITDLGNDPLASTTTTASFQGTASPALTRAVPTDARTVVLTFTGPVGDSALAPSTYKIEQLDAAGNVIGTLAVNDVAFVGGQRTVVALSTATQAGARYRVSTTPALSDVAGTPLPSVSTEIQGIDGQPKLVSVTPAGPNAALLTFTQPISDDALSPSSYIIKSTAGATLPVQGAQFLGGDRRVVQITTGPQSAVGYTIQTISATDLFGNPVAAPGAAGAFQGVAVPSLVRAVPTDTTHLFLTFGGPVGDSALSPGSYRVDKLDASNNVVGSLTVAAASFVGDQRLVVSLTTGYQSNARYRISTTSTLTNDVGSALPLAQVDFQGIGSAPKVTDVQPTGPTSILITFNVPMSDDALTPSVYVIKDADGQVLPVTDVQFVGTDRRVVQLTTGVQTGGNYTLISVTATDQGGSPVAAVGATGGFQGVPAPTLVRAIPSDPTHVVLTFTGPVGDSALAPSSYKIDRLDALGNVVGSVAISSAAFVGDQKTVVSLTTSYQTDAPYRISTTSSLTDSTGRAIAAASLSYRGVGVQPRLVGVSATDPTTLVLAMSVPLSDDALAPSSYAIRNAAGTPLPVLDAAFLGTDRRVLRLTTGQQATGAYTIQTIGATDQDGNPVAAPGAVGGFQGVSAPTLVTVVPSDSTHLILTFGSPMGDSALSPASYRIDLLNSQGVSVGTLAITAAAFLGDQKTVVSLTTANQSGVSYRVSTTNSLSDASGATLPTVQQVVLGIGSPASLIGATATSPTKILLVLSVPMSDDALAPTSYTIKTSAGVTLPVLSARFLGSERRLVEVTTGPQSAVAYTIQTIGATSTNGGSVTVNSSTAGLQGLPAPALSNATPTDPTHLVLTFGGPVGDSALAPSSYRIDKLDALGNVLGSLPITALTFLGDQRRVVSIATAFQTSGSYRITTTASLTDATGATMPLVQITFAGLGSPAKLVGASSTSASTMTLTFNVAMSDDVLSPSSYVIKDALNLTLPVISATFVGTEHRVVQITTGLQASGTYTIQSIGATDVSGNSVATIGVVGNVPGIAAPSVSSATSTDSTHVYLTFGAPVGDSALAPSSYKIDKLDAQGVVIGQLSISSAAFVGSQRTVVSLTTPTQTEGNYRISTTDALRDVSGAAVPKVQITFGGVGSQAKLVSVASTSSTTLIVTFNVPMSDDALTPASYVILDSGGHPVQITGVRFLGTERRIVELSTTPLSNQTYTVNSINATDVTGSTTIIPISTTINTFPGPGNTGVSTPVDAPPRVAGAASLSNTTVLVSFSEPMADNALSTASYFIVQQNVSSEVGYVPILSADWYSADHRAVLLTTGSQNELTYAVTALNVTDLAGNALSPPVFANNQKIDPTTAVFPGTPAKGGEIVDSDGDGLPDSVEVRGWTVKVKLLDGTTISRQVTSDPGDPTQPVNSPRNVAARDTDGDGLPDAQELNIGSDPRNKDTDGDQLNDYAEFNEIFSNTNAQDTDGDGLDDSLEFNFFHTSPLYDDTDGDQIKDGDEINSAVRNPLVADMPATDIQVGNINLELDVRFTETTSTGTRNLQSKVVSSSLNQSADTSFSHTDSNTQEFGLKLGHEIKFPGENALFSVAGISVMEPKSEKFTNETSYTGSWSSESTSESARSTEQAYESSLQSDVEATQGSDVTREVDGAKMSIALTLKSVGTLAFRVKNLLVTALMQDPQNPANLRPIATLRPDFEPDDGFALGPLVPQRGPLILSSESIFPNLVESLMQNPRGLVFKIANYDVLDELGRNFAFTSQDILERTALLSFDFGGEDNNKDGEGDLAEKYRVAANTGRVIDTNGDGSVDSNDHRAAFDAAGKPVGIQVKDAFAAIGLTHYLTKATPGAVTGATPTTLLDSTAGWTPGGFAGGHVVITGGRGAGQARRILGNTATALTVVGAWDSDRTPDGTSRYIITQEYQEDGTTPADLSSLEKLHNSYSTTFTDAGQEVIWRVRETENSLTLRKQWVVLLAQGDIDSSAGFNGRIVKPGEEIRLAYVQDLDGDNLPASLEYILGTVDSATDVYNNTTWADLAKDSSGNPIPQPDGIPDSIDTDHDGLPDRVETLIGWTVDLGGKGTRRVTSSGYLKDSDFDGVPDGEEAPAATAFEDLNNDGLVDRFNPNLVDYALDFVTDPTNPDTDGDNVARWIYRDPTDNTSRLSDDYLEIYGDGVTTGTTPSADLIPGVHVGGLYRVKPIYTGGAIFKTRSSPNLADTDGDGLNDGNEVRFGLDPYRAGDKDSDRDGLPDIVETTGWIVKYRAVSTVPLQEGALISVPVTSDPFNPDTDGDGLSDFLEFDLSDGKSVLPVSSNPRLADTDGDGLTDKQEYLGVVVRDLGIVTLNPLDADTDNDLLSDGDEAALVDIESKRWVVAPVGKTPYRVYSDPRFADADFDGVVDGVEFADLNHDGQVDANAYRTDPNNGNTDGDKFDDGTELANGTNPLKPDLDVILVTILFNTLAITDDGDWDPGDNQGDFVFDFGIRRLGAGVDRFNQPFNSIVHDGIAMDDPFKFQLKLNDNSVENYLPPKSQGDPQSLEQNFESRGIAFDGDNGGSTLNLARILPYGMRAITFAMTPDQSFSIEGIVGELDLGGVNNNVGPSGRDPANPYDYSLQYAYLGGVDGLQATDKSAGSGADSGGNTSATPPKIRPVFFGKDLQAAKTPFTDYEIKFTTSDMIYSSAPYLNAPRNDPFAGSMTFTIFVG